MGLGKGAATTNRSCYVTQAESRKETAAIGRGLLQGSHITKDQGFHYCGIVAPEPICRRLFTTVPGITELSISSPISRAISLRAYKHTTVATMNRSPRPREK